MVAAGTNVLLTQESGNITLAERDTTGKTGATITQMPTGEELEKVLKNMSPEQQQQLAQLYMFMTQHPEARVDLKSLGNVRQAVTSTNNQVGHLLKPANFWLTCTAVCLLLTLANLTLRMVCLFNFCAPLQHALELCTTMHLSLIACTCSRL